jgi:hypothetical protein
MFGTAQARFSVVGSALSLGAVLALTFTAACSSKEPQAEQRSTRTVAVAEPISAAPLSTGEPKVTVASAALPATQVKATTAAASTLLKPSTPTRATSSLKVKRFVVSTGVVDREPVATEEVLSSSGAPIYAFAELSNADGESENVRITFERKGGKEQVGNVTLPVPAKASRHRTWATTRYIRAAGVWEAVLWSESGVELSRTSFEVAES